MKKIIFLASLLLSACNPSLVRTPAPQTPVDLQTSARASGVWQPYELYFTLLSHYQNGQARVWVLAEPAIKLADMTVSAEQIEVHDQAPRVPTRLITAWAQLVRAHFLTPCPARHITYKINQPASTFELEVTGGVCP